MCDGPDGPTLVGEQIFHSFFGQDDLVIRTCDDSPITDGVTSWSCEGETSVAERAVVTDIGVRELPDGTELNVLIITTELVLGDQPGNVESIEQWWDFGSGLPVYERRSYNFTLETPLGDAEYLEEYEAVLPSLTPVS